MTFPNIFPSLYTRLSVCIAAALLVACGGGGGGGGGGNNVPVGAANILSGEPANVYLKASDTDPGIFDAAQERFRAYECLNASSGEIDLGCDQFGTSVALSADGATLAVGAPFQDSSDAISDNNDIPNSGAVYVYVLDGTGWRFAAKLKAPVPAREDFFGEAIALSGDGQTLAVGGTGTDFDAGAVDIFTPGAGDTWDHRERVVSTDSQPGGRFGYSVAVNLDGTKLAVGAREEDAAYLFTLAAGSVSGNAVQVTGAGGDFGYAVALNDAGTRLAVGAPLESLSAGAVYLFTADGIQERRLQQETPAGDSWFGAALSFNENGNRLAVGAPLEDAGGRTDSGAAYVFSSNASQLLTRVVAPNAGDGDEFGRAVDLVDSGNSLYVGAPLEDGLSRNVFAADAAPGANEAEYPDSNDNLPFNNSDSGAVYLFTVSSSVEKFEYYIKAFNTQQGDKFGNALAAIYSDDKTTLLVGALLEDNPAKGVASTTNTVPDLRRSQAGAAYIFE